MNKYDSMIACNKKASEEKVNRAVTEIRQMLTEREKVTVPKLTKRTGLSRGFFYKNETVRKEMDRALEQQAGMIDPKRYIGDIVLKNRINVLEEQIRGSSAHHPDQMNISVVTCNIQSTQHILLPFKKSFLLPRQNERTVFNI